MSPFRPAGRRSDTPIFEEARLRGWRGNVYSLLCLVAILTACSGGTTSKARASDPPASEIVSNAAAALKDVKSLHFKLEHENGTTPIPFSLQLVGVEGDLALPDRLAADVQAKAGSAAVSVKVIGIGGDTWVTNPFSRQWQKFAGVSIRDIADPAAIVNGVVGSLSDATVAGHDIVDGVDCYRLTGKLDSSALTQAFSTAVPGHSLDVQAWVGVKDSLTRRVRVQGPVTEGDANGIVRVINLTKFNQPVTIQPPPS